MGRLFSGLSTLAFPPQQLVAASKPSSKSGFPCYHRKVHNLKIRLPCFTTLSISSANRADLVRHTPVSDSASVADTAFSESGTAAKGRALAPLSWIPKTPLFEAMAAPHDKRFPLQAGKCVEREKGKVRGDIAGANQLQAHLKRFALAASLVESSVEIQDDADTITALLCMHMSPEQEIPPSVCNGILTRKVKALMDSLHATPIKRSAGEVNQVNCALC